MGAAYYVVVNSADPGFDTMLKYKAIESVRVRNTDRTQSPTACR